MKGIYLIGLLTTAFGLAVGSQAAAQQDNPDRVTVSFSDPSRPGLVKGHMGEGSISVKAYDGKDVIVETKASGRSRPRRSSNSNTQNSNTQGLRRIDNSSSGWIVKKKKNVR